jgi:hypothetical protein
MAYTFNFEIVLQAWRELAGGIGATVQLSAAAMFFSLFIGLIGVLSKQWGHVEHHRKR